MPDEPTAPDEDDALADLRARIEATREAAERLAGDATGARAEWERGEVPRSGWATPADQQQSTDELRSLAALLGSLGELMPPELVAQFRELMRQLLLLVRALIDWWVQRIDGALVGPAKAEANGDPYVEDIPIS